MKQSAISTAMSEPSFYPTSPERVELIQTHISWVFISGDEVYKVKKAVELTPKVEFVPLADIFNPGATLKATRVVDQRPQG